MSEPIMQLDGVTFGYRRDQTVIDGVTIGVRRGKVTALIGPNGCGKTTLIKLMLGSVAPRAGEVRLGEQRLGRITAAERAAWLSYVPQRSAVVFAFTVHQLVSMSRYALDDDEAAIETAIQACDIGDIIDHSFAELSVGQQQRVLLARAMAQASGAGRIMLLDEPTSAMDLAHAHRTMARLEALAAKGLAVVVVLHDVNLAARYADDVWLMQGGRIVCDGPWSTVLHPSVLEPVYGVRLRAMIDAEAPPGEKSRSERPGFEAFLPGGDDGK